MITMGIKRIMKHLFSDSSILYVELNFSLKNNLKERNTKREEKQNEKRQLIEMTGLFVLFDIRGKPVEMTGLYYLF